MPTRAQLPTPPAAPRWLRTGLLALVALAAAALTGCGTAPVEPAAQSAPSAEPQGGAAAPRFEPGVGIAGAMGQVAGRTDNLLVYLPQAGDTTQAIAQRFLGSADNDWQIAQTNGQGWLVSAGRPLVVPLRAPNPMGIGGDGFQTVPVLCYHRLGSGVSKMIVAPAQFEAQIEWLSRHHYKVLRLSELRAFLAGERALPQRSVVITFDDGYESVYRHAYPVLKKHGFSATLFVYTDFVGARDGLAWTQLQEMAASGVIDVQAHSKSHRNLVERGAAESDAAYRQSIENEVRLPRQLIERRLTAANAQVRAYAYPFGDANEAVLEALERNGYELGLTVNPGGNPFYAHPYMLRRTMIFGDHNIEDFKARLQVRKSLARP